ncbi:TonB-dependent receptor [Altererythrobacter epoxidivorans]|nr:TonB-dependent receptor [Altererythrobacter epoxidivorans]
MKAPSSPMKTTRIVSRLAIASVLAMCFAAVPAYAQQADPAEGQEHAEPAKDEVAADRADAGQDDFHSRSLDYQGNIIVSASGLKQLDLLAGTSVIEALELQREMAGQVGEVLAKLPGVSATGFSPGASRPVLRGFSGDRVRVLVDGLGSIDISNTSADHAVTIDPLTAERIEVLRGPAVMLFGSQAIGGAVNVIDKRIPLRIPSEPIHVDGLASLDTVSDKREAGLSVDLPVGSKFVVHADGSWRKTGDLGIGGYVASPTLRSELLTQADDVAGSDPDAAGELRDLANLRGTLPGSATETYTGNIGAAFFAGESNLGASIGVYDTVYGVPVRPGGGEDEEVSIDLHQFRADLRGELALGSGMFEQLKTRVGFSDYSHSELEGDEVGTTFDVQGLEARMELVQKDTRTWRGSVGAQYYYRDFLATGEEAYIAPNETEQFAVFALQEFGGGPIQVEAAGRFETSTVTAKSIGEDRSFNTVSGAVSLVYETDQALRYGINLSRAARAPSAEEMFSNGAHIATQAFEVGDPDLKSETALGAEAFLRGRIAGAELNVAVFKQWFSDYIYQSATGDIEDGLPVFEYLQADASYFGVEGEISLPIYDNGPFALLADLRGDYIRAELDDGTPLPRIPPLSLLGALEAQTERFDARAEVQWFAKQDRVAPLETPTDSFTLVNLSLSWKPIRGNESVTLLVGADNIFDVDGRRHASFTKDFVPVAGRNFKASVRFSL